MPIKQTHDDLPKAAPVERHRPAFGRRVQLPWIDGALQRWLAAQDQMERPHAVEDRAWRASWSATRCDRQLWYQMNRVAETEPMTIADRWRLNLGSIIGLQIAVHLMEELGEAGLIVYPEVPTDLRHIGIDGSTFVEFVARDSEDVARHVIEIKSINGFGFKDVAIGQKGNPPAPRFGHVVQTAIEAAAYGVGGTLVYLATELIGQGIADSKHLSDIDRFCAVYRFTAEECKKIAADEAARIARIGEVDKPPVRRLSSPDYPPSAVITNPVKGHWTVTVDDGVVDHGNAWFCDYCSFRTQCVMDGA